MSEITEEPLEAAPLSKEEAGEQREGEPVDTPSPRKGRGRIPDLSEIVEGKRTKKTVARLELQISKPKEKLKVEDGGGDKLGEIPRTNHMIGKLKPEDLKPLHTIMFDRPGKTASMRKNMRQFNGFLFDVNSKQFAKKRDKLLRWSSLTNSKLRAICKVLDLEKKGSQLDLVNRILIFLSAPKNSGKPLLSKKKKRSKKKLSGSDAKAKTKSKPRPKSTSASPKKTKSGSKSKAIVMDSSSDDEEEDEDEKTGTQAEEEDEEEAKESGNEKKTDDSNDWGDEEEEEEEEEEDDDDEEEDESPKSKSAARKPAAGKRPRAPTKKSPVPRKRTKKVLSESDSDSDEKPKKKAAAKRAPRAKPAAKTKKADSSSNIKKTTSTVSEESSDDDRPLIKMVRQAPSDEQLKETVQGLLKDAELEEITMKQICQRVYDKYPDHDLASRKDYIKQTVKSLIT